MMKGLHKYLITEALTEALQKLLAAKEKEGLHSDLPGKNGWFSSAESCIEFLTKDREGKKLKDKYFDKYGISEKNMIQAIEDMYKKAKTISGVNKITWNTCPFVFGPDDMCIRQAYADQIEDYKNFLNDVKTVNKPYNPASLKKYHNGFGGSKSSKGLEYEIIIISLIIQFITMAILIDPKGKKHISENEFKIAFDLEDKQLWPILNRMYNMYDGGAFNSIIQRYIKDPTMDLTKYVILTGGGKTDRNARQLLFDKKTFKLSIDNIEEDVIESGKIIADVTILGQNENDNVYISVKLDLAQLSGATFENCFNALVILNIKSGTPWEDIKDDKNIIGFINLLNTFGFDPKDIYEQYINNNFKDLKPTDEYDKKSLGIFALKLLGGHYWYTKPKEIVYLSENMKTPLEFTVNKYHASDSGKTITFKGILNNELKAEFVYRTDGNGEFPHRMFIRVNVPELIDIVTK